MQEEDGYFMVEKVLDKRFNYKQRRTEYLIKWMGYPDSDNTWEPMAHLTQVSRLIDEFERRLQAKRKPTVTKKRTKHTSPAPKRPPAQKAPSPPRDVPVQAEPPAEPVKVETLPLFPDLVPRPPSLRIDHPVRIIGCKHYEGLVYYSVLFRMRKDESVPMIGVYTHQELKRNRSDLLSEFLLEQPTMPFYNF